MNPQSAGLTRSIPAWAGETYLSIGRRYILKVYPRVGGGNRDGGKANLLSGGLSPRGRGKLAGGVVPPVSSRSIPAGAGETAEAANPKPSAPVYPRVGGGNVGKAGFCLAAHGLSPRGRGKH